MGLPNYDPMLLTEELAKEIWNRSCSDIDYEAITGERKPTWDEVEEFNKDDFRMMARISIEFLFGKIKHEQSH